MSPSKQLRRLKKQPRNRSCSLPRRRSGAINGRLRRSVTISPVHPVSLYAGDLPSHDQVEREWERKGHWLRGNRTEETQRSQYIPQVRGRIYREARRERGEEDRLEDERRLGVGDPDLVVWGEEDSGDPRQLSFRRKFWITVFCCMLTINVTFASSSPGSAMTQIAETFKVDKEIALMVTSMFLCGFVAGPTIWAPASELFGRRPVFIGTILAYTLCTVGQAVGKRIVIILITRFFAGVFASVPLANCGGVIADIWDPGQRVIANAMFSGSVFIGPILGPVVGDFIARSTLGWRWIFWIMIVFSVSCWILLLAFLPETYAPILLTRRAQCLRKQDPNKYGKKYAAVERKYHVTKALVKRAMVRPFTLLVKEPILILVTIYLSIHLVARVVLYSLFSLFPLIWDESRCLGHGWEGFIFIGVGAGTMIGAVFSIYTQRHYPLLLAKWHGSPPPEERLIGAMYAGPCLTISIFWLGWTGAFYSIPWWVPALATIPLGASFTLIFISYSSYIVDTYLLFAASALAANIIFRSAVGASFPLFTRQMYEALSIQGGCSLIGGISAALLPIPFFFYKYGTKIRERSKFARCADIKIKEQVEEEERRAKRKVEVEGQEPTNEDSTSTAV
ncbi:multidrug transporter [Hysterangium stoloniferum]|nr:multidrug transporter [Hysterangium stoloniferum]